MNTAIENAPSPVTPPVIPTEPAAVVPPVPGTPPVVAPPAPVVAPEPAVPLTAESFKMPEGLTVEPEALKGFVDLLNDDKLSGTEKGQKLLDLQAGVMTKVNEAMAKQVTDLHEGWRSEAEKDPEVGGAKLAPTLGKIGQLVVEYGSKELNEVLDATGVGNNVHIIKFLGKVAEALGEGGPVLGDPPKTQLGLAEKMFPSMVKNGV